MSFDLASHDLELHGATVSFWAVSSIRGERWHATVPLVVSDRRWTTQQIDIDHMTWRQSWSRSGNRSLRQTLAGVDSFGVGFVGFDGEPTGAIGIRSVEVASCP